MVPLWPPNKGSGSQFGEIVYICVQHMPLAPTDKDGGTIDLVHTKSLSHNHSLVHWRIPAHVPPPQTTLLIRWFRRKTDVSLMKHCYKVSLRNNLQIKRLFCPIEWPKMQKKHLMLIETCTKWLTPANTSPLGIGWWRVKATKSDTIAEVSAFKVHIYNRNNISVKKYWK